MVPRRALEDCHILVGRSKRQRRPSNSGERTVLLTRITSTPPLSRSFNAVEINRSLPLFLVLINIFKRTGEIFFPRIPFISRPKTRKEVLLFRGRRKRERGQGERTCRSLERAHLHQHMPPGNISMGTR